MERVGLSKAQVNRAQADHDAARHRDGKGPTSNYPDKIYREKRERPLLVVHLLALKEEGEVRSNPVVGYSISFPKTDREQRTVEYMVNSVWYAEEFGAESDDEDTAGSDA